MTWASTSGACGLRAKILGPEAGKGQRPVGQSRAPSCCPDRQPEQELSSSVWRLNLLLSGSAAWASPALPVPPPSSPAGCPFSSHAPLVLPFSVEPHSSTCPAGLGPLLHKAGSDPSAPLIPLPGPSQGTQRQPHTAHLVPRLRFRCKGLTSKGSCSPGIPGCSLRPASLRVPLLPAPLPGQLPSAPATPDTSISQTLHMHSAMV